MVNAVFCAYSTPEEIEAAASNNKLGIIHPSAITIVSRAQELDWIATPQSKINLSLKRGVIGGAIVGAIIGLAMVLYVGSFNTFWGELSLVVWESFGWALFGMIVGSSGLLAESPVPRALVHHFEEALDQGKILVSLQAEDRQKLDEIASSLYSMGAADMHETSGLAA